jgi:hypothetical protein
VPENVFASASLDHAADGVAFGMIFNALMRPEVLNCEHIAPIFRLLAQSAPCRHDVHEHDDKAGQYAASHSGHLQSLQDQAAVGKLPRAMGERYDQPGTWCDIVNVK